MIPRGEQGSRDGKEETVTRTGLGTGSRGKTSTGMSTRGCRDKSKNGYENRDR